MKNENECLEYRNFYGYNLYFWCTLDTFVMKYPIKRWTIMDWDEIQWLQG